MRTVIASLAIAFFLAFTPAQAETLPQEQGHELLEKELMQRWAQINDVAWPLLASNYELCTDIQGWLPGFSAMTVPDGSGQVVFHVASGSPAALAGLQPGDVVTAVNGNSTTHRRSERAETNYKRRLGDGLQSGQPLQVTATRDAESFSAEITPVQGCDIELVYTGTATPSMSNERQLMLGTVMENYVRTEDEARLYLAREFARVILDQAGSNRRFGRGMGAVMGVASRITGHDMDNAYANRAIGNMFRGKQQDEAADELSLYLAARAGVDISQAPLFWEHVFDNRTGNATVGRLFGTSPGSPERLEGFQQVAERIAELQQTGQPLFPSES